MSTKPGQLHLHGSKDLSKLTFFSIDPIEIESDASFRFRIPKAEWTRAINEMSKKRKNAAQEYFESIRANPYALEWMIDQYVYCLQDLHDQLETTFRVIYNDKVEEWKIVDSIVEEFRAEFDQYGLPTPV